MRVKKTQRVKLIDLSTLHHARLAAMRLNPKRVELPNALGLFHTRKRVSLDLMSS
jgi:hypothetical protein